MIKLVVFDMDGVIANSKNSYVETIQKVLAKNGFSFSKKHISDSLGLRMANTLRNIHAFHLKIFNKLSDDVHSAIFFQAKNLEICPSVKETLKILKKDRKKVVLLTNSRQGYALAFLEKHGIKKYFDSVLGGDQFVTKVGALKNLFREYRINPEEAVYVGDRVGDWETARAVGCGSAIVYTCSWEKEKIKDKKYKENRIKTLKDLKNYLK